MKKAVALLLFVWSTFTLYAQQDTIVKTSGTKIPVNIKLVKSFEVVYGKPEWTAGKVKTMSKSVISRIEYADGRVDTFFIMKGKDISAASPVLKSDSMYQYGVKDARFYYTRFSGASTGTLLATFPGSPAIGLITAIATSATPPKLKNLGYPNPALMNNPQYREGYERKAWSIKRGKVWAGWGIGVACTAAFYFLLTSLGNH